jgi:hypothetical protein
MKNEMKEKRNQKPETRNQKQETRNKKQETRNKKQKTRKTKACKRDMASTRKTGANCELCHIKLLFSSHLSDFVEIILYIKHYGY